MRSLNTLSKGKLLLILGLLFEFDKVTMTITQIIIKAAIIIVTSPPRLFVANILSIICPKVNDMPRGTNPLGVFWFLSIFRVVCREVEAGVGVEILEFDLGFEAGLGLFSDGG